MARASTYELTVYDDGTGTVTEWERDEETGCLIFRFRRFLDERETRRAAYILGYPYAPLPAALEVPESPIRADGGRRGSAVRRAGPWRWLRQLT